MSHRHQPATTTHTLELDQVREIARRLGRPGHAPVTAGTLGLAGAPAGVPLAFATTMFGLGTPHGTTLGAQAVLRSITAEGSPEFPYVQGHFLDDGQERVIELHSQVLHQLCLRMGLSQCWGTDAVLTGSSIR
ncbi:hypothetical protein KIH74_05175 [Kineosporia sp. J2-2]|uniref:YcaO domain-containing protein n=1 Tax=Kineosporia corallincola TaxID=2835133 RepID=A0ABS5TB54_9ACTN|nr:hypothetical protein [Kineosporia corallincola]MBT0768303.1 hypothetical protein [Kineosporia corallincola]